MATKGGSGVALDKALPATRLLEKRRLMFQIQEALEAQKVEFATKEEILRKREESLRLKDLELQESLIGFSKFLQENGIKKARAEKKAADEMRIRIEKEAEIRQLEETHAGTQSKKTSITKELVRILPYNKYLETVVDYGGQYHEINDLLVRYQTLAATNKDLKTHIEDCGIMIEKIRADMQNYIKTSNNQMLSLNNDISITKQMYQKKRRETSDIQLLMDSVLHLAAQRTLARSQVCLAAEYLFNRICLNSSVKHYPHTNPLNQLSAAADYISDLIFTIRLHKGTPNRKEMLLFGRFGQKNKFPKGSGKPKRKVPS